MGKAQDFWNTVSFLQGCGEDPANAKSMKEALLRLAGMVSEEMAEGTLGEVLEICSEAVGNTEYDIFGEITEHYITLLREAKVTVLSEFRFSSYSNPRTVVVDGVEYDFDDIFCHNDAEATNALYAIDVLLGECGHHLEESLHLIEERVMRQFAK